MGYHFQISEIKSILDLYYHAKMSAGFALCADKQLPASFEAQTKIRLKDGVRLLWEQNDPFIYDKGKISKISAVIHLKYGTNPVKIVWQSKSGRIYDIADEDIDCNDIEFWLEGLDPEYCYKNMYPKWSLFPFPDSTVENFNFNKKNELQLSEEFISCADNQLSPQFEKTTGLKINKHISINIGRDDNFAYIRDIISGLAVVLYVNHNWNHDITMVWKSKSGRIYNPGDTDIDCNDIEFWLEGLDPVLYHKQMFPKAELPFKLKNLSYLLVINRLNIDCTMEMKLKEEEIPNANDISEKVDDFIHQFNEKSVKKNREDGVVHNWRHSIENKKLVYEIDTGFAGPALMKKLLPFLSSLNCFEAIEIN